MKSHLLKLSYNGGIIQHYFQLLMMLPMFYYVYSSKFMIKLPSKFVHLELHHFKSSVQHIFSKFQRTFFCTKQCLSIIACIVGVNDLASLNINRK
jgi:hypothetical protein